MDNEQKKTIPLGESTAYVSEYDASLLYPIARAEARKHLGLLNDLPFKGVDCWTGYEVSWLDQKGKPQIRLAEFWFECDSPYIIESKSFKLYLNSFNQTSFLSEQTVLERMQTDLSNAADTAVQVKLYSLADEKALLINSLPGELIDDIAISVNDYHPNPALLNVDTNTLVSHKTLYSHLLKTNCPVTGQPDWATVFIEYSGVYIKPESLLAYIVSFREHQDFHENCVERIFCDIKQSCQPDHLSVYARYTRRGGLDINPLRSDYPEVSAGQAEKGSQLQAMTLRTVRQ
ncbi:MAG: NADPH-dependent 7-cyano-7-deazaguanine reductase QueF [Cellvibrionaceae bacterium]